MLFQMNLHGLPVVPVGSSFGFQVRLPVLFWIFPPPPLYTSRGVFKYAMESDLEYFLLFWEHWFQVLFRG